MLSNEEVRCGCEDLWCLLFGRLTRKVWVTLIEWLVVARHHEFFFYPTEDLPGIVADFQSEGWL